MPHELLNMDEIIQRILGGEKEKFRQIVHIHKDHLLRMAYSFTGNWNDALDLTQNTFLKVYQTLGKYDSNKSFRKWLFTIHLNNCRSAYQQRRKHHMDDYTDPDQLTSVDNHTGEALPVSLIQQCLNRLSWRQRCTFQLVVLDEHSRDEAARIMGCSAVTVRIHLMRAKSNLKTMLTNAGIEP